MNPFSDICAQGGASVTLHTETHGDKCPCFDEQMGVKSLQWHRENPDAQVCGPDGYLPGDSQDTEFKAFVEPASKKSPQIIQRTFGMVQVHDLYFIGPVEVPVTGLNQVTDYILYRGEKYVVINPEVMYFQNAPHHFEAGLRKRD